MEEQHILSETSSFQGFKHKNGAGKGAFLKYFSL